MSFNFNKKILISFVGINDGGELIGNSDGAIYSALKNDSFDEVILLYNDNIVSKHSFKQILDYLKDKLISEKLVKNVKQHLIDLKDVTDHNEIYSKLKKITDTLHKGEDVSYTAAISSGTPAMQVCWILLAESGDFSSEYPLKLIKVKDPKFGASQNIVVKLDTALPRILRLQNELVEIKKNLIPLLELNIKKGTVNIGSLVVDLSPIEFSYYRYFCERQINNEPLEKYSGITVSLKFMEKVYSFHEETFYDLELNRDDLKKMIKREEELTITTFRGNVSKINKKLREVLNNEIVFNEYRVVSEGKRGAKFYGIKANPTKIKIIK